MCIEFATNDISHVLTTRYFLLLCLGSTKSKHLKKKLMLGTNFCCIYHLSLSLSHSNPFSVLCFYVLKSNFAFIFSKRTVVRMVRLDQMFEHTRSVLRPYEDAHLPTSARGSEWKSSVCWWKPRKKRLCMPTYISFSTKK